MTQVIVLPNKRAVTLGQYAKAWRLVIAVPREQLLAGWDYFETEAWRILFQMREGLQDRINLRGGSRPREITERRLFAKMDAAARRGALQFECRWCGQAILADRYLHRHSRFCSQSCQRDYAS